MTKITIEQKKATGFYSQGTLRILVPTGRNWRSKRVACTAALGIHFVALKPMFIGFREHPDDKEKYANWVKLVVGYRNY